MTFLDIAHGIHDRLLPISKIAAAVLAAISLVWGAGVVVGKANTNLATLMDGFGEMKQEQREQRDRIVRLEAEGKGNNKLLVDIKGIVERTNAPALAQIPVNSAPKRRP